MKQKPEQIVEKLLALVDDLQQEITVDFVLVAVQELRQSINAVELKIHELRRTFEG